MQDLGAVDVDHHRAGRARRRRPGRRRRSSTSAAEVDLGCRRRACWAVARRTTTNSRSSMRRSRRSTLRRHGVERGRASRLVDGDAPRGPACGPPPLTMVIGVRSSWPITATRSALMRSTSLPAGDVVEHDDTASVRPASATWRAATRGSTRSWPWASTTATLGAAVGRRRRGARLERVALPSRAGDGLAELERAESPKSVAAAGLTTQEAPVGRRRRGRASGTAPAAAASTCVADRERRRRSSGPRSGATDGPAERRRAGRRRSPSGRPGEEQQEWPAGRPYERAATRGLAVGRRGAATRAPAS